MLMAGVAYSGSIHAKCLDTYNQLNLGALRRVASKLCAGVIGGDVVDADEDADL